MSPANGHANDSANIPTAAVRQFAPLASDTNIPAVLTPNAAKITELIANLEVPFDPSVIEWRVTNTSKGGSPRGQVMPYADQRAYTDRLNALVTPAGWTRRYTIHIVGWKTSSRPARVNGLPGRCAMHVRISTLYPHPPLLFKACGTHLWVRALVKGERPNAETKLCVAPYWNCYDNGVVCTGSMRIPREKSVAAIDVWEESFFQSEFTYASGLRKHVRFRGGFLPMWQSLAGQKVFQAKYLVKLPQTLSEFVRNDDHRYRNDNRHEA